MADDRNAFDALCAERTQLVIDLEAIEANREPWIPGRDADRLRKRLALIDELLSDELRRAGLRAARDTDA
jgi:hypothetical protein